jgi:hypothetical protein
MITWFLRCVAFLGLGVGGDELWHSFYDQVGNSLEIFHIGLTIFLLGCILGKLAYTSK